MLLLKSLSVRRVLNQSILMEFCTINSDAAASMVLSRKSIQELKRLYKEWTEAGVSTSPRKQLQL